MSGSLPGMEMMDAQHPLADAVHDRWVESHTDAARMALTSGRASLLVEAAKAGSRVVFVAPDGARLTFPLLSLMQRVGADWVTRHPVGGFFAPSRGFACAQPEDVFRVDPTADRPAVGVGSAGQAAGLVEAVQLSVSVHHPATMDVLLGKTVEVLSERLCGIAPQAWGIHEPMTVAWDRVRLTRLCRSHAPAESRVSVMGGGSTPFSATIRVSRSSRGITEETRFLAPHPVGASRGDAVTDTLVELAVAQRALFGTAWATLAHPDATVPSIFTERPFPLALLLGPQMVRDVGSRLGQVERFTMARQVGSDRTPSAVVGIEGIGDVAWQCFSRVVTTLGVEAIVSPVGAGQAPHAS